MLLCPPHFHSQGPRLLIGLESGEVRLYHSMQRRRSNPLFTPRMLSLSPSSSYSSPKPGLRLLPTSPIPKPSLFPQDRHRHHPPIFSNSCDLPRTQSMNIYRCFFSGPTEPVSVSNNPELRSDDPDSESLVVVSFYKFAEFTDYAHMRTPLKKLCQELRVSGGIILAPEGINGSICGTRESVERVLGFIQNDDRLKVLRQVESPVSPEEEAIHHGHTSNSPLAAGEDAPFRWDHVRVKLKKEIVTLGMPGVSPTERVGTYVSPRDWNALISDPDTVVIDVRNNYETRIGKFKGAVDPCTMAFREFPSWVEDEFRVSHANDKHSKVKVNGSNGSTTERVNVLDKKMPQRVAMYCTGGIRCEKASSYLLSKGFKEVYHLEGGILKYLEEVPKSESLWEGECFVFDKRVSVEHGLVQGTFKLCFGCKQPVSDADMEAPEWEYGVCCPHCYNLKSDEEKERARARQRQFKTWGVIGGPDKGRRPASNSDIN
ncbi:LOW QUALITY PROTEIN: rhodanese-like domain-containing protein 7 [Juglans microcarpa x Juglans regia]|uniref:LOW QUALITY PROTEIN: rhodanese-like domain-containing protein 7 n=1 Tax=Juglans microcarpa x Juglans regia TaxID=2249226 RepID=UPI001B7E5B95|nr:LOW QUALITY PROTEIN: rhodanese-like domain-containing protein 7 [Juglans microcarpa x Juglans regia]